jgi:hypothetical protein
MDVYFLHPEAVANSGDDLSQVVDFAAPLVLRDLPHH